MSIILYALLCPFLVCIITFVPSLMMWGRMVMNLLTRRCNLEECTVIVVIHMYVWNGRIATELNLKITHCRLILLTGIQAVAIRFYHNEPSNEYLTVCTRAYEKRSYHNVSNKRARVDHVHSIIYTVVSRCSETQTYSIIHAFASISCRLHYSP